MIFIRLLNLLTGYVVFDCCGFFAERFLNLSSKRHLTMWGIKRLKTGCIRARIKAKDFRFLRVPARRSNVRLRIVKKRGLPFILFRYRKRSGILAGTVIFFVILWVLSTFIWSVEVSGNATVKSEDIIKILSDYNIKSGALNFMCNRADAELNIQNEFPQITWVEIQIKGSKAIVTVKEGVIPPPVIKDSEACNIIAAKDGQITHLEVYEGIPMIKKGDTVRKGELIVSGVLDSQVQGVRFVHARAKVRANTITQITTEMPLVKKEITPTGKFYKRYRLQFSNISVKLYLNNKIKYDQYESKEYIREMSIGPDIILPIKVITEKYSQTETFTRNLTEEEAKKEAEEELINQEKSKLNGINVTDRKVTFKTENEKVICTGEYISEDDIAITERIIT